MRTARVITLIAILSLGLVLTGCIALDSGSTPGGKAWPPSSSGRPSFYYFGSGS